MKKLLSVVLGALPLWGAFSASAQVHDPLCPCGAHQPNSEADGIPLGELELELPDGLPAQFDLTLKIGDELYPLAFEKSYIYGPNTRFLVQGADGELTQIDPGADCSYLGTVAGKAGLTISAQLTPYGLAATIELVDGSRYVIEPDWDDIDSDIHSVIFAKSVAVEDPTTGEEAIQAIDTTQVPNVSVVTGQKKSARAAALPAGVAEGRRARQSSGSGATLPPSRVMEVLEYEVGVEVGSRAFFGGHNGDINQAMTNVGRIPNNMDRRYLRGAAIKHVLGTVIIRQDAATDPLRNAINDNGSSDLNAFRNYWENNRAEVGTSHDIAVYHVDFAPSGRAFLNSIGRGDRYAVSCSRGGTSWADGTLVHEFGHSWNLRHNNDAPISVYSFNRDTEPPSNFYEAKPRDNNGRNSAGGSHTYVSVMNGSGNNNIGRLSTQEAATVLSTKNNRSNFGVTVSNPGNVPPFGVYDIVRASGGPTTIDVIANDYDANNHVLDVELLDTRSHGGGTIAISQGTGPGGRCELIYTPASGYNGTDFFHYTVRDSTGQSDFGAVYVLNDGPIVIDTNATEFDYDLGAPGSPVQANFTALTPEAFGDVSWSDPKPRGEDRGQLSGVNNANRDVIISSNTTTLNHKLGNGTWAVYMNMGDPTRSRDQMRVSAENGQVVRDNLGSNTGEIINVGFDVQVIDGELNLTFSDEGGANSAWSLTRLSLQLVDSSVDTDGDSLNDTLEMQFFGNLTTSDGLPNQDFDDDGLIDRDEFDLGANPTIADSDGDQLTDGNEANVHNTDPTRKDSDGDGYLDGSEVARGSSPTNASDVPEIPGLVVYYPLDEASGDTARNIGFLGESGDATQNSGTIGWASSGQIAGDGALDLDGDSSLLSSSPLSEGVTAFTISLWVDPDDINQFTGVYVGRNNPGNWGINLNDGRVDVRFVGSNDGSFGLDSANGSITANGGWYHVVQTWETDADRTSSVGNVYLNGQLVQTTTGARNDFSLPSEGFFLGDDPAVGGRKLDGRIDDIAVFDRAVTATEVTSIYQMGLAGRPIIDASLNTSDDIDSDGLSDEAERAAFGNLTTTSGGDDEDFDGDGLTDRFEIEQSGTNPALADSDKDSLTDREELNIYNTNALNPDSDGDKFGDGTEVIHGSNPNVASSTPVVADLLAYYPFDEGSGTTANNLSTVGAALNAEQNQGTIGWSTTDVIAGGGSLELDGSSSLLAPSPFTESTTAFTISLWVDPDVISQFTGVYAGRNSPGNWGININQERIDARFGTVGDGSFGLDSADGSVTADAGWIHVVQTWQSNGTATSSALYIDGVLAATSTGARPDFSQPTLGFFIGDDPAVNNRELDGRIDELAVFSRALTAEEIGRIHSFGLDGIVVLNAVPPMGETPLQAPTVANFRRDATSGNLSFDIQTEAGVTYKLQASTTLEENSWTDLETVAGNGSAHSFDFPIAPETALKRFYRVEASR